MKIGSVLWTVAFTMPAKPVKFARYCLTQWIPKLPRSFEIRWVRQYLVNIVLFGIRDMQTSETAKVKATCTSALLIFFLVFLHSPYICSKHCFDLNCCGKMTQCGAVIMWAVFSVILIVSYAISFASSVSNVSFAVLKCRREYHDIFNPL